MSLFGRAGAEPEPKQPHDLPQRLTVLMTVKAAPNPSDTYGETVCVAGLRLDPSHEGWVRLYPINFRYLDDEQQFRKYDVVTLEAVPNRNDPRHESWRPNLETLKRQAHLPPWQKRSRLIKPHTEESMCGLLDAVRTGPPARSLGLVEPRAIDGLDVRPHPGWSPAEQGKIDRYVAQLDLFGADRTPLQAPRFKAWYRYRCLEVGCRGHNQGLLDWELVALQRRVQDRADDDVARVIREKFLDEMCGASREVLFYVGNQAKRQQTFSVLGVYWPPRE
jgi:hypothetical protein